MTPYRPAVERFAEKIKLDPDTGCWIWIASFMPSGTPQMRFNGKPDWACRVSAEIFLDGMPDGMELSMTCDNRKCVNPNHFVFNEPKSDFERFVSYLLLDETTGCWNWTGALSDKGYAMFKIPGRTSYWAHRISHEFFVGPVPDGLEIDHMCRNRRCVCPNHLRAITHFENTDHQRRKTHCPKGHEYAADNIYWTKTNYGIGWGRACKICAIARSHKRYQRLRSQGAI